MYYLGYDIGGTNTKACIIDDHNNILAESKIKTNTYYDSESFARSMFGLACDLCKMANIRVSDLTSVGIGIPGLINIRSGKLIYAVNMPFESLAIRKILKPYLKVPIYLENDANCAALGEFYLGAGKGSKRFVSISLGTGVGAGIIHNGKIYHGGNGAAGEIGHHVIQKDGQICPCGRRGCWEQYSSVPALKRMTKEIAEEFPESVLAEMIRTDSHISGKTAFAAAKVHDEAGMKVVQMYNEYLAVGLANVINIFQPDMLAISGGVSNEDESLLLTPVRAMTLNDCMMSKTRHKTKIVNASLGDHAGVYGAALLGKKKRI